MNRHRLRGLAAVPVLVNVLLLAGLVAGTVVLVSHEMGRFDAWLAHAGRLGALLAAVAGWLLHALLILLAISVDVVLLILLGRVIAGPFLDMLSERVEQIASGREPPPFALGRVLVGMGMALRDALASLLRWLLLNVAILLLTFVPIIGAFAAVLTWSTTALLLAEELVDLPLARRMVPYRRARHRCPREHGYPRRRCRHRQDGRPERHLWPLPRDRSRQRAGHPLRALQQHRCEGEGPNHRRSGRCQSRQVRQRHRLSPPLRGDRQWPERRPGAVADAEVTDHISRGR
jgi:CysZ protein